MANITKYIVSGRREEPIAAVAGATAPWPGSPEALEARFRELLRRHRPAGASNDHHGLQGLLGEVAWRRLPEAVRVRFSEPVRHVDYTGEFDIVRASLLGRAIAWVSTLIGTPVVPRTGQGVSAIIHVGPVERGASWLREYQWPHGRVCRVHSTKVIGADGTLVEELPAGLRMPLDVFERRGVLHFVSLGYYFDTGVRFGARTVKIALPHWLSPGTTHVEHADETDGWFRFTMTVTHPLFGELFYQTGRFHAAHSGVSNQTEETPPHLDTKARGNGCDACVARAGDLS
jgi:Domain of unknown function (DUF4166)